MAKTKEKDFNAMLHDSKDMPKVKELTAPEVIKRYGGSKMLLAPPIEYDTLIKKIEKGKLTTTEQLRTTLAKKHNADFTCPLTAGIFISIVAYASEQRQENLTPYWRVLKKDGELNEKFPGGIEAQGRKLEEEGFSIIEKGRTKIKYFVKGYENFLADLEK
jgi:hypothetical protein